MATEREKKRIEAFRAELTDELASVFLNSTEKFEEVRKLFLTKGKNLEEEYFNINLIIFDLQKYIVTFTGRLYYSNDVKQANYSPRLAYASIYLTKIIFAHFEGTRKTPCMIEIISLLCNLLRFKEIDFEMRDLISLLCENFLLVSDELDREAMPNFSYTVLNFLLNATLFGNETLDTHIKRIYLVRKILPDSSYLAPDLELEDKIYKTVTSYPYLSVKEGKKFVGYLMSQDEERFDTVCQIFFDNYKSMPLSVVAGYGTVFYEVWRISDFEYGRVLSFMRNLVCSFLECPRKGYNLDTDGGKLFAVLSEFNSFKRTNKNFDYVITYIYSDLIMTSFKQTQTYIICNAAQILFDIFPLHEPMHTQHHDVENQINLMIRCLEHSSSFIRIIANRGILSVMSKYFHLFTNKSVKDILTILFCKAPFDISAMARKSLLDGLIFIIEDPISSTRNTALLYITPFFNGLRVLFNDESEVVRQTFLRFLNKVKIHLPDVNYLELIPMKAFITNLSEEGPEICMLVSQLLKDEIHIKGHDDESFIDELSKMIEWNSEGAKRIFYYSNNIFSASEAYSVIYLIINFIHKNLAMYKNYLEKEQESDGSLEDEDMGPSTSTCERSKCPQQFQLPGILKNIAVMIDIAAIVWTVFHIQLSSHPDIDSLNGLVCESIPLILNTYESITVYCSIVKLAAHVPVNKINSETDLISKCTAVVQDLTVHDDHYLKSIVYSLCFWDLGDEVIKVINEYIRVVLPEEKIRITATGKKLNETYRTLETDLRSFGERQRKYCRVLKLLEFAITISSNEAYFKTKYFKELYHIYSLLDKIKTTYLEICKNKRLLALVEDTTLEKTVSLYLKLMRVIHKQHVGNVTDEVPQFDAVHASMAALSFAKESLVPAFPTREFPGLCSDLFVKCCIINIYEANLLIQNGITNEVHCKTLCAHVADLLNINAKWFLECAAETMAVIIKSAPKYLKEHENALLTNELLHFHTSIFSSLHNIKILPDLETTQKEFKNVLLLENNLYCFVEALFLKFTMDSEYVETALTSFLDACLLILTREIIDKKRYILRKELSRQPFFVKSILTFLSSWSYCDKVLPIIARLIINSRRNGKRLLSCLSVLYTLSFGFKDVYMKSHLCSAVYTCYRAIMSDYKETARGPPDPALLKSERLNVVKFALPGFKELCKLLGVYVREGNPDDETFPTTIPDFRIERKFLSK